MIRGRIGVSLLLVNMGRPRIHPIEFICLECGKIILNEHGCKIIQFCSHKCKATNFAKNNKEYLKNLALKNIAGWNKGLRGFRSGERPYMQGRIGTFLGKKHKPESLIRMSLAKLGKKNPKMQGKNHWNWKGTTPIQTTIRMSLEYKQWCKRVFERDNYTCQGCFMRGGKLAPHHIVPFSKIFKDFLNLYPQFSPFEDIETLVRLTTTYEPFWDINNGKTFCYDCHKKTDSYGSNIKCLKNL